MRATQNMVLVPISHASGRYPCLIDVPDRAHPLYGNGGYGFHPVPEIAAVRAALPRPPLHPHAPTSQVGVRNAAKTSSDVLRWEHPAIERLRGWITDAAWALNDHVDADRPHGDAANVALGIAFAVWRGRRIVLGKWADRQLIRIQFKGGKGQVQRIEREPAADRRRSRSASHADPARQGRVPDRAQAELRYPASTSARENRCRRQRRPGRQGPVRAGRGLLGGKRAHALRDRMATRPSIRLTRHDRPDPCGDRRRQGSHRGGQRRVEGGPEPPARRAPGIRRQRGCCRQRPGQHRQAVRRPARARSSASSYTRNSNPPGPRSTPMVLRPATRALALAAFLLGAVSSHACAGMPSSEGVHPMKRVWELPTAIRAPVPKPSITSSLPVTKPVRSASPGRVPLRKSVFLVRAGQCV